MLNDFQVLYSVLREPKSTKLEAEVGWGQSQFFLLRESLGSGIENFREFGIPKKSGNRIFGNSVFPFGITEFSGFPNY